MWTDSQANWKPGVRTARCMDKQVYWQQGVLIASCTDSQLYWQPGLLKSRCTDSQVYGQPGVLTAGSTGSRVYWNLGALTARSTDSQVYWQPVVLIASCTDSHAGSSCVFEVCLPSKVYYLPIYLYHWKSFCRLLASHLERWEYVNVTWHQPWARKENCQMHNMTMAQDYHLSSILSYSAVVQCMEVQYNSV